VIYNLSHFPANRYHTSCRSAPISRATATNPGHHTACRLTLTDTVPDGTRHEILDGDTIEEQLQAWRERLRYIGIDTPETKHSKT
jgi:endonuclease YncB( thermonuclease family)